MTTSWALAAHGRFVDALRTHASGTLLALASAIGGTSAVIVAARGKRFAWQPSETAIAVMALVLVGLVLCEWIVRLVSA